MSDQVDERFNIEVAVYDAADIHRSATMRLNGLPADRVHDALLDAARTLASTYPQPIDFKRTTWIQESENDEVEGADRPSE